MKVKLYYENIQNSEITSWKYRSNDFSAWDEDRKIQLYCITEDDVYLYEQIGYHEEIHSAGLKSVT